MRWCNRSSCTLARLLLLHISFNWLLLLQTKYFSQIVHIVESIIFGIIISFSHNGCFFHWIWSRNFITDRRCSSFRARNMVLLQRTFSASWCEWWANWDTTSQMLFSTIFLKMAVFAAKIVIWTIWRWYDSTTLVNVSTSSPVYLALPTTCCLGRVLILVVNCLDGFFMVLRLDETTYYLMVIDLVHFNLIKGPQNFNIFF